MPLVIDGEIVAAVPTVETFVKKFPQFKERSEWLLKQSLREVGPQGLLYVGQRELAGTFPKDEVISILGSEDATTCHIAVIRHTDSGAAALIHFDGCSVVKGLETMIATVEGLTKDTSAGRLEVHLVGGFLDERKNSHEVSDKVLRALCESPHELHLITACITHFNTEYRSSIPFPIIYGVAYDVKSGELYKATFPDKGPDLALRSARHFTGGKENIKIYNPHANQLEIGPFHYDSFPNVELFLSLPDNKIRKYLSTSPEQEPESFVDSVRASLVQIRDFPRPLETVFKAGDSRNYVKDTATGKWIPST